MENEEQIKLWNGPAGAGWVQAQESLDRLFKPFEELLLAALPEKKTQRLLDVGCGTGATTLAAARRLGPGARCVGVDVSEPMIALARARAAREQSTAEFLVADAQVRDFAGAAFDAVVSRFGVMFFEDPVRAFANLRRAAGDGAVLRCIAFRGVDENPFMTAAERAAAPLLPGLPARRPDAPGQFAFADATRVRGILERAGWAGVELQPIDVGCVMPERELDQYLTHLGPVALALRAADEATRERVMGAVREAFAAFVRGGEVRFNAACWLLVGSATS